MRLGCWVSLAMALGPGCTATPPSAPEPAAGAATGGLFADEPAALATAREWHTATLLTDGRLLVVGGYGATGLTSAELYDPATGAVSPAMPLTTPRWFHSAVMLRSGRVMVIAGKSRINPDTNTDTTELYDPATGTWSPGPPLTFPRERHTATVLDDGRVLVAGSWQGQTPTNELFDPDAGQWQSLPGSMAISRGEHCATRLSDGRVLVSGGVRFLDVLLDHAETFDPRTLQWSDAGHFPVARYYSMCARLPDGRVLIAGGQAAPSAMSLDTGAVFDPVVGSWAPIGNIMSDRRGVGTASLLPSGAVLLAGGAPSADLFAFDAGAFTPAGPMLDRFAHTATVLPTGEVALVAGAGAGGRSATITVFWPAAARWVPAASLAAPAARHTATVLPSGEVLVVGASAERFDPAKGEWAAAPGLTEPRVGHTATLMLDGRVLICGGGAATCERYDPATQRFYPTAALSTARAGHTATLLRDGRVLVTGGSRGGAALDSTELYEPLTDTWASGPALPLARSGHFATLLADGRVLLAGGGAGAGDSAEVFDPRTARFTATPPLAAGHGEAVGALLPSGRVLIAGGCCPLTARAEEFDPPTNTWVRVQDLPLATHGAAGVVTHSGRLFVIGAGTDGGSTGSLSAQYDARTRAFAEVPAPAALRVGPTASPLPDGRWLVVGGQSASGAALASAEVFAEVDEPPARPTLAPLPRVVPGSPFVITGARWLGGPEASNGRFGGSATDYPLLRLERADTGEVRYARLSGFTASRADAVLPADTNPGWYFARVVVAGVGSAAQPVLVAPPGLEGDGGLVQSTGGPSPRHYAVGCGCSTGASWPGLLGLMLLGRCARRRLRPRAGEESTVSRRAARRASSAQASADSI